MKPCEQCLRNAATDQKVTFPDKLGQLKAELIVERIAAEQTGRIFRAHECANEQRGCSVRRHCDSTSAGVKSVWPQENEPPAVPTSAAR